MANESVMVAYIDIEVNQKQVQQQFQQTRQKLTRNSQQISSSFNKSFKTITNGAQRTARQLQAMMKVAMTPMLAGGGLALKKFMDSAGGENAKREWMAVNKGLDEALARIGKMLWSSKYFGKSISNWGTELSKFLNSLKPEQIQKMVNAFEMLAKSMAGLKVGQMFTGLLQGVVALGTAIGGLKLISKGMEFENAVKNNAWSFGSEGKGVNKMAVMSPIPMGGMEKMKAMWVAFSAVAKKVAKIGTVAMAIIISAFGWMVGLIEAFGVKIGDLKGATTFAWNIIKVTFSSVLKLIELLTNVFFYLGKTVGAMAGLMMNLMKSLLTFDFKGMSGNISSFWQQLQKIWEDFSKAMTEPWDFKPDTSGLDPRNKPESDTAPQSVVSVNKLRKQFTDIIKPFRAFVDGINTQRTALEAELGKSTDIFLQETIRAKIEKLAESLKNGTDSFGRQVEDFKKVMEVVGQDEITGKSERFKNLMENVEFALDKVARSGEDAGKAMEELAKDLKESMDALRVGTKYEKEKKKINEEMAEDALDFNNKMAKAKREGGKPLGYSGENIGIAGTDWINFVSKIKFDWQQKLAEVNEELANLTDENNKQTDKNNKELEKLNASMEEYNRLRKKGFSSDFAEEMAF